MDWDNPSIKQIQDCVRQAGFIPDDSWSILEGRIISCKADKEGSERTEILLERIA
jgi:hypothetical protein